MGTSKDAEDHRMTPDDLVRFVRRDWAAVAASKAAYWAERKRVMTPEDVWRLGDELRQIALAAHPDWPSPGERADDHRTHRRVAEALRAVIATC